MSASCIYEGTVRHRRRSPSREFEHRLALAYLDLDELPTLLSGRLVREPPGLLRFRRRDYHGDPAVPLGQAVRDTIEAHTGARPEGPIRVLTHVRSFGHCFNPVSFYYCMSADASRVDSILLEVTNTPWRERHAYVMRSEHSDSRVLAGTFTKALHVSPFMSMQHVYEARASTPGKRLSVHIESQTGGTSGFDATLALERRPLTSGTARSLTARYPLATVRVLGLIYAHALGLKLAGAPVHPHPARVGQPGETPR